MKQKWQTQGNVPEESLRREEGVKKVVKSLWVATAGTGCWWQWTERAEERQKMAATAVATTVIVLAGVDGIRGAMDTADCMARIRRCPSQRVRQARHRSAKWLASLCLPSRPQALDIIIDRFRLLIY